MKNYNHLLTGFCLLVCAQSAFAEKQKMVQHGSHEHGVARMTIATTDTGLEVALETPAANVFGFEHKASTEEDHHVVHEAVEKLEAGGSIFSMNAAAGCSFDKAVVESNIAESHDKEKHDDHNDHKDEKHDDHDDHKDEKHDDHDDHKDEKHDDHDDHKDEKHDDHKDEKHDDHKDEKHDDHDDHKDEKHDDHDDHKGETHSDVDVTWTFNCEKPASIKSVTTKLFSAFPNGFEELDVEWVTANGAGKVELKSDDTITLE